MLLLLVLPGCLLGQAPPPDNASKAAANVSNSDKEFLKNIITEDTFEIELANLALQKSKTPSVLGYANAILSSDPGMESRADSVAQLLGLQVPQNLPANLSAIENHLSSLSGKEFDAAYMNFEAQRQTHDLELVRKTASTTKNDEVRKFAELITPSVKKAVRLATDYSSVQKQSGAATRAARPDQP